ncbi:hypothetical protein [Nitrospira sp. Nam74]
MANKLDHKELVAFDELTHSNVWELEALVEVGVAKGVISFERYTAMEFLPG